jgi:steroid 5-alpha reductase family enzyme
MTIEPIFVYGGIFATVVLLQSACLFLVMQLKRDNSLIDIAYGPLFFTSSLITLLLTNHAGALSILMTALMGIWALRLSYRIGKKNWGRPEDVRYATWRADWTARGQLYFVFRSFLQINLLQGLLIVLIASPFIISLTAKNFSWIFVILGTAVTLLGLTLETIADKQIDNFIRDKKAGTNKELFLAKGLFRYSRRPNYFGETLIWWGLALMVLPLPYGHLALIGPLTITYIVTKITGPMLEKIFIEKYGAPYKAYMKETSYFIPLPPQKHT